MYRDTDGRLAVPIKLGAFDDAEAAGAGAAAIAKAIDRPVLSKDDWARLMMAEA